jgi:ABC-2 type transport system permease protein
MRKTLTVAIREYNAAVRTKAFIISVVIMPVFVGGSIVAIKLLENQIDTTEKKVAIIDHTGKIAPVIVKAAELRNDTEIKDKQTGARIKPAYHFEIVPPNALDPQAQRLELSRLVKEKKLHAFLEIGPNVIEPAGPRDEQARIAYHAENAALDDVRSWVAAPINSQLRSLRLASENLDEAAVARVTQLIPVEGLGLVTVDAATGEVKAAGRSNEFAAIIVPMIMMMMMFMLILMGAQPLLHSVIEEKMQRIAEVLLGSLTPFQLMMGKLVGTVGVSLTVVSIYFAGGALVAERMNATQYIPYHVLPWFFAFQIAAVFMYGAIHAAVGSACSDLKEAQSLMMPVMLPMIFPMFVWLNAVREPMSRFATWTSLFPPFTPMLMLIRQATPAGVPAWQPWVGLAGVIVFTLICVWLAGRIFRVGLLMQGKSPKLADLARWAFSG